MRTRLEKLLQRFNNWIGGADREEDDEVQPFGGKGWTCPRCGKVMHEGCREDHEESHEEEEAKHEEGRTSVSTSEGSVRGELVDDYDADWLEDEEENDLVIQEASGGQGTGRSEHLTRLYHRIEEILDEEGEVRVTQSTHIGSIRGGDIMDRARKAVRRQDGADLDDYVFVNHMTAKWPKKIVRDK